MPDPFKHVRPGESLVGNLQATAWNAMLDAGKAYRQSRPEARGGDPAFPRQAPVWVRNDTGGDLDRASVLGLNGPVFTPFDSLDAFHRDVAFAGVTPDATTHRGKFCITLDPVADGLFCRAFLGGVCAVQVNLLDPDHAWADVTDADATQLTSGYDGSAQILWKEADDGYYGYGYTTGTQWALVRLGPARATASWFLTTSTVTAASGSPWTPHSGTATRVRWNGSSWTTVETGVTVWNGNEKAGASGSYVYCVLGDDGRWWCSVPAKCANWT